MKLVTTHQMRELERQAAKVGLPSEVLMENAGLAVAKEVKKLLGDVAGYPISILIGPGNNGGDGLVAARHLHDWGAKVSLWLYRQREADPNYHLTQERGISSIQVDSGEELATLSTVLSSSKIVIDALFGTGKSRPFSGILKQLLSQVKVAKEKRPELTILALDLPSGLDADTGAIDPACLTADVTITLACPKLGLFSSPGSERTGKLIVADIGIPPSLSEDIPTEVITPEWVKSMLPKRPATANKGSFGKVLISAGSVNYIGAAYLACAGAIRVGAGLVTLATARSLQPILATKLTEVTHAPLPESEPGIIHAEAAEVLKEWLPGYDVLLLGCGLGQHPSVMEFVRSSLLSLPPTSQLALVLDADALNTLAKNPGWWQELSRDAVITPHPGEMSRLSGLSVSQIQSNRLGLTQQMAAEWQKTVVLKGAYTVVAAPNGQAKLNPIANPGLASAGTGDVLSGAIAGLLAQGLSPFAAAACGVYLHGAAGEIVKKELGDAGMVASDLLPALPLAIKMLKGSSKAFNFCYQSDILGLRQAGFGRL